ncbi:MAG: hypothetical protein IKV79_05665 [Oscillospiraceae bacterium]|nr:hypothetical protein [Oscillospiraceae bacterium]
MAENIVIAKRLVGADSISARLWQSVALAWRAEVVAPYKTGRRGRRPLRWVRP